jgi:hypothetical protein
MYTVVLRVQDVPLLMPPILVYCALITLRARGYYCHVSSVILREDYIYLYVHI